MCSHPGKITEGPALVYNTTGVQSWEYLSKTLTVGAFWALVREEAGCISTSEKAPNNIPTEVKQRQRRHTRSFKSTETPGRNNPSPTPEIKDSEIGLSSESDSDDPQEHSNSEDEAKAHPDDTRVFLSENVRAVLQDSGGQEQTQVGTDTVYVGDDFGHEASQLLDEMGEYVGPPRHPPPPPTPPPPPSHPSESPPSPSAAYVVLSPIPSHPSQHSLPTPSPRYKSPSAPTASNRLNISVILLLRKMCIIDDGSAAQVEQANSLYSSALRDPRRRGANDATVENILRVAYNSTAQPALADGELLGTWEECMGLKRVMNVKEKRESLQQNQKNNDRKRRKYRENADHRTNKKRLAVASYGREKFAHDVLRGQLDPGMISCLFRPCLYVDTACFYPIMTYLHDLLLYIVLLVIIIIIIVIINYHWYYYWYYYKCC